MRKCRRTAAVVMLTVMLLLAFSSHVFAGEFSDVRTTAPYYKAVETLSQKGVITGRDNGVFAPGENTTRAEFCAIIARANEYVPGYYEPEGPLPFPDVPATHWAVPYISFCYERGYINGFEDGTFRPDSYVTYEQAVKMVVCTSGLGDDSLSSHDARWYVGYLQVAKEYNLLNGANVVVGNSANRAFVAQVVYNAMLVTEEPPAPAPVPEPEPTAEPEPEPTAAPEPEPTAAPEPEPAVAPEPESTVAPEPEPAPAPAPEPTPAPVVPKEPGQITVVIDPGHNNSITDTGATGCGLREQDITYQIAAKVKPLLEQQGIHVIMTRNQQTDNVSTESVSDSLRKRADIANRAGADLFLSIHCNAGGGTGTETYYYNNSDVGKRLASCIQRNVVAQVGLTSRGVKSAGYAVLRYTDMPAALLETAFIDTAGDAAKLASDSSQQDYARGIVQGICEYLGIAYQG